MATLHIIGKSPFRDDALDSCLRAASDGGAVLLIEDGVYAAVADTAASGKLLARADMRFFVLGPDLKARGISEENIMDAVKVVDYGGFVELAAEQDRVQSWL